MIRLDTKQEVTTYKQLDLFSPNNGTAQVPILTDTSPNIGTPQVPNLGHPIKQNIKQENSVSKTPTEIFKRNKKLNDAVNNLGHVPKSVPMLAEVEDFFKENNYPAEEAKKFFHYNNGKNWMLTDKLPIKNWKSIAHKWMLNPKKKTVQQQQPNPVTEIQYLYESFLEGKKIFHHITVEHFQQLKLYVTDEVMQQTWKERINQVSGTNQHSLTELWQGYLTNDPNNQLVQKDKPNFIALAKRIAVIIHFNNLKNQTT